MNANPFEIPMMFTRLWAESSLRLMQATTELWSGVLSPPTARPSTSTAKPWWMPPETPGLGLTPGASWPAGFPMAWGASWPTAMIPSAFAVPGPGPASLFPWALAPQTAFANPLGMWQQLVQQMAMPALSSGAPRTRQASASLPDTTELWQPMAAAYRTASGHAMAAVLRTMADVMENSGRGPSPSAYWPALSNRH